MDLDWFRQILDTESTSGTERILAERLASLLKTPSNSISTFEVGDGTLNVLASWGCPKVWFCTHCDTVPPYIPPVFRNIATGDLLPDGTAAREDDTLITGRGTCDAKGQIFSMFEACKTLEAEGFTDFALLVLAGEETGSFGARAYTRDCPGGDLVVVGEPTGGRMVSASKGTKAFSIRIEGIPCHSGYPSLGASAVDRFVDFCNALRAKEFPIDPVLGETTWNIGRLRSDNPQNILSPCVEFRLYFRTTFASDPLVESTVQGMESEWIRVESLGGDTPMEYFTVPGIPLTTVSFGSDAPRLDKFARRALCGPGKIEVAHTDKEYILLSELEEARQTYIKIYKSCAL